MATKQTTGNNPFERAALQEILLEKDTSEQPCGFVTQKKLFYRHAPHMHSLVFAPPDVALHVSQIHNAFSAKTWGEFQAHIPEDEFSELLNSQYEEWGDLFVIPNAEDPFKPESICGAFLEGDYPRWLQTDQDIWVPKKILERWGTVESSVFNGPFWVIDPEQEQEIVGELGKLGIPAERRDDLRFH